MSEVDVELGTSSASSNYSTENESSENIAVEPKTEVPGVRVDVRKVVFSVPSSKKDKKAGILEKVILHGITASFKPGTSTAILGSSGAGKSTFLNLISGRSVGTLTGKVLYNGNDLKDATQLLHNRVAYVMQDDVMLGTQTPREILEFASRLKTGDIKHVDEVLSELNLRQCEGTRVGKAGETRGISGGERKRTAIAQEMLTNPSVLFLDEPTSGLDSSNALQVGCLMRDLARAGRTVVATIHQPSSELFFTFDQVLVLAGGRLVYGGPPNGLTDYLAQAGYKCPRHTNPADYILSITHVNHSESSAEEAKERVGALTSAWEASEHARALRKDRPFKENLQDSRFARTQQGAFTQLRYLLKRDMLDYIREPLKIRANFSKEVFMALLLGLIYLQLDTDQASISSRSGALFFYCFYVTMSAIMAIVNTFPLEKNLFFREHANHLYGTTPYYLAKVLIDLPFSLVIGSIGATIYYWMIGFVQEGDNFGIFLAAILILQQIGAGWGMFLGTAAKDSTVAVTLVPVTVVPFFIFSGLLLNSKTTPSYFVWAEYISYLRYGFQIVMKNEFEHLSFGCETDELISIGGNATRCPIETGNEYLKSLEMDDISIGNNFVVLLAFWLGMRLLAYVCLLILAKKHKTNA